MKTTTLSQHFSLSASTQKQLGMVAAGIAALAISAKIQFPAGFFIPGTLQLLVVLVIGAAYGSRLGAATVLSYLAAGFVGLPVFAMGAAAGPAYFLGLTAGYLYGFVASAYVVGLLSERGFDRNYITMAVAMVVGVLITHAFGSAWLLLLGQNEAALSWFVGFVGFDLIKVVVAVIAFPVIWAMIDERH